MNRVQFALFPALLLGILAILTFASLANTSENVQAAADAQGLVDTPTATSPTLKPTVRQPTLAEPAQPSAKQPAGSCPVSTRFPASIRQWCVLIDKYSHQSGVDANLIAAVMLQESGGNSKAYSGSGAVGLMQVMPRDGLAARFQCGSKPCFASRPSMAELYDPEYNLSYGVRMLAGLIQKTGSPREALRSYGPMDVGYTYADKVLRIFNAYQ